MSIAQPCCFYISFIRDLPLQETRERSDIDEDMNICQTRKLSFLKNQESRLLKQNKFNEKVSFQPT